MNEKDKPSLKRYSFQNICGQKLVENWSRIPQLSLYKRVVLERDIISSAQFI